MDVDVRGERWWWWVSHHHVVLWKWMEQMVVVLHCIRSLAEVAEISNKKIRIKNIEKTYNKAQTACQNASFGP